MHGIDFVACPECGAPASVRDVIYMESTDGPVEHFRIACVRHHYFLTPSAGLTHL